MSTEIENFIGINLGTRPETCVKHGDFESKNYFRNKWSSCPTCATEERLEQERIVAEAEEKKRQIAWGLRVKDAGIPERFKDRTFKNYIAETQQQKQALSTAIEFASNIEANIKAGRCLIMCGRPGTGKGHLAAAIGLDALEKRKLVMFMTVIRAIRRVKDTWNKNSTETESQAVSAMVHPDLLILDEVGIQFGSDTEQMILFDIINERYEKRKSTIIISNLQIGDVKKFLGERIFDRLREDGGKYIPFEWDSFRNRKEVVYDAASPRLDTLTHRRIV